MRAAGTRRPRTRGMLEARREFALHGESERSGVPVEELRGRRDEARASAGERLRTRREAIAAGASLAGGAFLAGIQW